MAWWNLLRPKPASQAQPIAFAPALAAAAGTLTAGAANTYGNLVQLLAAVAVDTWVIGIYLAAASQASERHSIALSREVAGAPPAVIEAQIQVYSRALAAEYHEYIPLGRLYFPVGSPVCAAVAHTTGGGTIIATVYYQTGLG